MTGIYGKLKDAAAKRAAYNRTIREIESMSTDAALDIGIFREDAEKIARKAVYGI